MNGYVRDFLKKMARHSVEVTVCEADVFGRNNSNYLDNVIGEARLSSIDRALEAELDATRFVPSQPKRKLS